MVLRLKARESRSPPGHQAGSRHCRKSRPLQPSGQLFSFGRNPDAPWRGTHRAQRPSTLLGQGQVATLGHAVSEHSAELAVVDAALSPVQQRNLEREWRCKVIDRTGLILDIFGERARTKEGAMQVELAHLQYQRSRLVRSWTHLGRQRGGFGFLGGPGETQIETDRRLIGERIAKIKKELEDVKRTRGLHRRGGAGGRKVILSDTVGFIADLPVQLVAAFRATLEEVLEADLILHVRDAAHEET